MSDRTPPRSLPETSAKPRFPHPRQAPSCRPDTGRPASQGISPPPTERRAGAPSPQPPGDLVEEHLRIGRKCGVNAHLKVPCLVAGMIGGADSIGDVGLLRHGAMPALCGGVRAPSTLGSFLRSFTWGERVAG